jgi:uncharacterized protein YbaA (DUF1428 family)
MSQFIDGFVIPVPKTKVAAYRRMAALGARLWREHGALDYKECLADSRAGSFALPFAQGLKLRKGETVAFSWITYKSRAHRDRVNAKVMKDPRMAAMCNPEEMPFDCKRMIHGGFNVVVSI